MIMQAKGLKRIDGRCAFGFSRTYLFFFSLVLVNRSAVYFS